MQTAPYPKPTYDSTCQRLSGQGQILLRTWYHLLAQCQCGQSSRQVLPFELLTAKASARQWALSDCSDAACFLAWLRSSFSAELRMPARVSNMLYSKSTWPKDCGNGPFQELCQARWRAPRHKYYQRSSIERWKEMKGGERWLVGKPGIQF